MSLTSFGSAMFPSAWTTSHLRHCRMSRSSALINSACRRQGSSFPALRGGKSMPRSLASSQGLFPIDLGSSG